MPESKNGTRERIMLRSMSRARRACCALAPLALLAGWVAFGNAQSRKNPNQLDAPPLINVEDKEDIHNPDSKVWVLDFKFYPPRLITVDIPGRGRKLCWYV